MRAFAVVLLVLFLFSCVAMAQSPEATVTGRVVDSSNATIVGAKVEIVNSDTGMMYSVETNSEGIYTIPSLQPGTYRMEVSKPGFKALLKPDIVLHVQDVVAINFSLPLGSVSETITVQAGVPTLNTESATVSTVVDRQFAENLPMNGRSFQTLIDLTPGVLVVPTGVADAGQFSVNGQRASSNYWAVDGVSANIGISATNIPGNGLGGALGSFGAAGGTNSLVSIDAMQEFRIQTSTYAPEFGRTPGAQISIVTRSGTNQFHGSAFDYFRNDALDANDWFANSANLPKAEERQNDFGGTFSGPIIKDRTFFFFSYEGLRLRLPQTELTTVPCDSTCTVNVRAVAVPAMQPFLNAFPLPNGPEVFASCTIATDPTCPPSGQQSTGTAQYNVSYSNASTLDAYSLRIDHKLSNSWSLFARYNYSPSEIADRGADDSPLSVVVPTSITTQTATAGATWIAAPNVANDFRFNYSRTQGSSSAYVDNFGGAIPLKALPFPDPFTAQNSSFVLGLYALKNGQQLTDGRLQENIQRQFNIVDALSMQVGRHALKFGFDFRRLSPVVNRSLYLQNPNFLDMPSAETGNPAFSFVESNLSSTFLFRNIGVYAQDTWRVASRLTITYGLRWDVDFAPSTTNGPNLVAITGYDPANLSNLALAPAGTAPFNTSFANIAPRVGAAYQLSSPNSWQTVIRAGFGVFYDMTSSAVGTMMPGANYPFGSYTLLSGGTFPFTPAQAAPPAISPANLTPAEGGTLFAFDPNLKMPYTLEWNFAVEQELGGPQSLSASYVGSSGRRLIQTAYIYSPNPNFYAAALTGNAATSNYNALQLQFQRHLSHGLQALASYTWSHSIDDASAGSSYIGSNTYSPTLGAEANRGPSDFDIRNSFSAGLTYEIPASRMNALTNAILSGWSVQTFVIAFSAPPVEVYYNLLSGTLLNSGIDVRPDVVPGQPLYLYGSRCIAVLGPPCGGGKGLNPAAFTAPPLNPETGNPLRQGDLGRNALRAFGASQWDFGIHREFPIHEQVKLQFRAELFNILNHPNFGPPSGALGSPQALDPQFGQSQAMLGPSLSGIQYSGSVGNGSLSPLYQIGRPRSVQLALKLMF